MFDCWSGFHQSEEKHKLLSQILICICNKWLLLWLLHLLCFCWHRLNFQLLFLLFVPLVLLLWCVYIISACCAGMFVCYQITLMWQMNAMYLWFSHDAEALGSSDITPFRNLPFYNVLARQGGLFYNGACLSFQASALYDIKWQPQKAAVQVTLLKCLLTKHSHTRFILSKVFRNYSQ